MKVIHENSQICLRGAAGKSLICSMLAFAMLLAVSIAPFVNAYAAGFPNDGQGVSKDARYYSTGTANRLGMVTSDEKRTITENFAFCLSSGKKFPFIAEDGHPHGIYTQERNLDKSKTYKLLSDNHTFSSTPKGEDAYWDRFTKLTYIYLEDPTNIVKQAWNGNYTKARDEFYNVIQNEFWFITDGHNVHPQGNSYLFYRTYSKEQQNAVYLVRDALNSISVPYEKMDFRGYRPEFVSGLGYQALFTGRYKDDPVDITVTKKWENVAVGVTTPDVYMQLYRQGTPEGDPVLVEKNQAKFTIQSKQTLGEYTVKEVNRDGSAWSAEGYEAGSVTKINDTTYEVTNKKTSVEPGIVKVTKQWRNVDADATKDRPDVYFQLLQNGTPVADKKQKWEDKDVEFAIPDKAALGSYSVMEVKADGSKWSEAQYDQPLITKKADGLFEVINRKSDDKKHQIKIKKVAEDGTTALAGAELIVKRVFEDGSGEYVDGIQGKWTSDASEKDKELTPGKYQLEEQKPPAGYKRANPIDFIVDGDGNLSIKQGDTYQPQADKKITLVNVKEDPKEYSVNIRKVAGDAAAPVLLSGAKFAVTGKANADPKKKIEWFSTSTASHELKLQSGEYTLTEVSAPEGYEALGKEVPFEVLDNGKVVLKTFDNNLVTIDNDTISVQNKKVPFIGTSASLRRADETLGKNVSVSVDSVESKNLIVNDDIYYSGFNAGDYVAVATLIKSNNENNQIGSAQKAFKVEDGKDTGSVKVEIPLDSKHFTDGENGLTVLERVYKAADVVNGKVKQNAQPVAKHDDVKDDNQTVVVNYVPKNYVFNVKKVDEKGDVLTGARLKVTYTDGTDVPHMGWNTLNVATPVRLAPGSYILEEVTTPKGYKTLQKTPFTVLDNGTVDFNGSKDVTVEEKQGQTTLITVVNVKETPHEFVNPDGNLATTVSANNVKAAKDKAANLTAQEVENKVSVTDEITYTGLVKGEKYEVTGTLNEISEEGKVVKAVATKKETFTADTAAGSGIWNLNFGDVELEAGKTYVVFEKAVSEKNNLFDKDGDGVPESKHELAHEDASDTAQTVVVGAVVPDPDPNPNPGPSPEPGPNPNPGPSPEPGPGPNPGPDPDPNPNPGPSPEPEPGPNPGPNPGENPDSNPGAEPSQPSVENSSTHQRHSASVRSMPDTGNSTAFGVFAVALSCSLIGIAMLRRKRVIAENKRI